DDRCRGALPAGTPALPPARVDGRAIAPRDRAPQTRAGQWRESDADTRDPDDFPADWPGGRLRTDSHPGHRAAGPPGPATLTAGARGGRGRRIEPPPPRPAGSTPPAGGGVAR